MRTSRYAARIGATAGLALLLAACSLPVEPGSDRPDTAPPAQLGPNIDTGPDVSAEEGTDISGEFDLTARVQSQFDDRTITIPMRAITDQQGTIRSGSATVSIELRRSDAPDQPGASTDQPAAIDESGAFQARIEGFTVPANSSEVLEEDADATVELDAQIVDDDCFRGDTTMTLKDVVTSGSTIPELVLEGPFAAHRLGASCDGAIGPDAGLDAGDTTDRRD